MPLPDLELQVLTDIFWRDTFLEQANLITELSINDFKDEDSRRMYVAFSGLLMKRIKIDPLSIYETDKELGLECSKWTIGKIPSVEDAQNHIKILKEKNYRDEVSLNTTKLLSKMVGEKNTDKFDEIKNEIIVELSRTELDTGSKLINPIELTEKIDENMAKDAGLEGHSWGITDLDTFTSGIITPRLVVVGGLKKTGKSRFAINAMHSLYKQGVPSVFISLEMPGYEVTKLHYSRYTGIPDTHFRSIGFLSNAEKDKYARAKKEIDWNLLLTECVSGLTFSRLIQRIRMYKRIYKNPVIFIDYLQRIKHDRNNQAQELEAGSNAIADATRLYDVPIVLLSQLSNLGEREEASISQLKGSGGIGESGDAILLLTNLYRKNKNEADKGKFEILIEQRYGDSGIVRCSADLGTSTFADLTAVNQDFRQDATFPEDNKFWNKD